MRPIVQKATEEAAIAAAEAIVMVERVLAAPVVTAAMAVVVKADVAN